MAAAQRDLFPSFIHKLSNDYFAKGTWGSRFLEVRRQLKTSYKKASTALVRVWLNPYCAEKLSFLLFLGMNTESMWAANIAKTVAHQKVKVPKNNDLRRAYRKLQAI